MKIILDELNSKEFFSNGGVVKVKLKSEELVKMFSGVEKHTFLNNKMYVRFMRELYLRYISAHSEASQSDVYERVNSMLEMTSYIGDKHYTLDPEYDGNKSLEMCLFYYCGENDVYEFNTKQYKDPYGIKNVNFSLIDETDTRWDEYMEQRIEKGYDVSELWSFDSTIARFILPRLKDFKDISADNTWPGDMTKLEWKGYLNEMIEGFEIIINDNPCKKQEEIDKEDRALDLFRKYFKNLWY